MKVQNQNSRENNNKIFKKIILVVMIFLYLDPAMGQANSPPGSLDRELSFELDPVKDAKSYEIKIKPIDGTPGTVILEKSSNLQFSKRLPLGKYEVTTRSIDRRDVPGNWSLVGNIEIKFKAPTIVSPNNESVIPIQNGTSRQVTFTWTHFHPNALTQVEITSQDGKSVFKEATLATSKVLSLKPGSYTWKISAAAPQGISIDGESQSTFTFIVKGLNLPDPIIAKPSKVPPE